MKRLVSILTIFSMICGAVGFSACNTNDSKLNIEQPTQSASNDEIYPAQNLNSTEDSDNVNGKRFSLTLEGFVEKYNNIQNSLGNDEKLSVGVWKKNGEAVNDNNGVKIQYYYYDDKDINYTATVEVESQKLLNIGCGTTTSKFMAQEDNAENGNQTIKKAAIMAEAACQFPSGSEEFLQNIFYRITTESSDSIWYQGFVFSLSTKEDKNDSKNNVLLFRVFPIKDELKEEWNLSEYGSN